MEESREMLIVNVLIAECHTFWITITSSYISAEAKPRLGVRGRCNDDGMNEGRTGWLLGSSVFQKKSVYPQ